MEDAICSLPEASGRSQSNCCLCLQSRQDGVGRTAVHTGMAQRLVSTVSVDLATSNSAAIKF